MRKNILCIFNTMRYYYTYLRDKENGIWKTVNFAKDQVDDGRQKSQ